MTTAALGQLVVSLEANIAQFSADMGRAAYMAEKSMAQIAAAANAAKMAFAPLVGAIAAISVSALARDVVEFAAALDDLSERTGTSVESLSKFAGVAKLTGRDFGEVEQAMGKLSKSIVEAQNNNSAAARAFLAFGLNVKDAGGNLKTAGALMGELAVVQKGFADGAGKSAAMAELLGKSGERLIPFLNDYAKYGDEVSEVTEEQASNSEALQIELGRLQMQMQTIVKEAILPMTSTLRDVVREFRDFVGAVTDTVATPDFGFFDSLRDTIRRTGAEIAAIKQAWDNAVLYFKGRGDERVAPGAAYDSYMVAAQNRELAASARELPPLLDAVTGSVKKQSLAFSDAASGAKKVADGHKAMADAIKRAYDNAINWIKAGEEIDEIQRKMEASTAKAELAMVTAAGAAEDAIRAYDEQTDAIGKTADALAELEIKRAAEIRDIRLMTGWGDRAVELYEAQVAAIRRRASVNATEIAEKEAQSVADAFARQQESISSSLADAIMRGFEDGKSFARNFLDTLYNWFRQTILRPTIQAIVSPVAQGIAGLFGSAGNVGSIAGLLGGGVGGVGNVGSLLGGSSLLGYGGVSGLFSGAGGIFGAGAIGNSFAMSSVGQALGLSAAGLDMAGGLALTGLGTALGTAIPVIGIALALAAAFGAFDRKGGPKTGGFASNIEGLERFFTPNQQDAAMQTALDKLNSDFTSTLRALGGSGTAGFALGFDEDPEGTAGSRISAQATVNGQSVFSLRDFDVGRGEGAVTAALDLAARRALLAALQASELPAEIAALFDGIVADSATAEQIDQLLAFGGAMRTITEALSGLDDIDATLARLNQGPLEALRDMGTELMDLAENFDGSVEATNALNQATATYYDAMVRTIAQIRQIKADLDAMFAGTSQSIFLAQRSPEFINSYLQTRGDELLNLVSASSDPNAINAWAREFNDILMQSWNLRTPEQQLADREGFLAAVDTFNRLVNERLDAIDADTRSNGRNVLEVASETISDAAADMKQGGADALAGGQLQLAAATTPLTIVVDYQTGEVGVRR